MTRLYSKIFDETRIVVLEFDQDLRFWTFYIGKNGGELEVMGGSELGGMPTEYFEFVMNFLEEIRYGS